MVPPRRLFHLAIPCRDLAEAERYYADGLGCTVARRYDDRITLDFFGDQLVCHLAADAIQARPEPYPRHFGITLRDRDRFDAVIDRVRRRGLPFLKKPWVRFAGRREEHSTFFLCDPSNNVLEFKHYRHPDQMY